MKQENTWKSQRYDSATFSTFHKYNRLYFGFEIGSTSCQIPYRKNELCRHHERCLRVCPADAPELCSGLAWEDSDSQGTLSAHCGSWQETCRADCEH